MAVKTTLDDLRRDIDKVDEQIHDLLMKRTELVEEIGRVKGNAKQAGGSACYLRPGREAEIVRRLLARHQGQFPKASVIHIWREIMAALVGIQAPFSVAAFMPERGAGYLEVARDQYGAYGNVTPYRSVGQVVRAVADGLHTVGIVPMPDRQGVEPWWTSLMADSPELPRVIARLPFGGPMPNRAEQVEALAIACTTPDATGFDRSYLALETEPDVSRGRLRTALSAAGLEPTDFPSASLDGGAWRHLVEISGFLAPDDRRLARLLEKKQTITHAVVVGGYAVPMSPEEMVDETASA